MIFFVALFLVALITVAYGHSKKDYWVGSALGLAFGYCLYATAMITFPREDTHEVSRQELHAIEAGEYKGYYLVANEPTGEVTYTVQEDGKTETVTGRHDLGIIIQDGRKEVTVEKSESHNYWVQPWVMTSYTKHEFHIPEGSYKPL